MSPIDQPATTKDQLLALGTSPGKQLDALLLREGIAPLVKSVDPYGEELMRSMDWVKLARFAEIGMGGDDAAADTLSTGLFAYDFHRGSDSRHREVDGSRIYPHSWDGLQYSAHGNAGGDTWLVRLDIPKDAPECTRIFLNSTVDWSLDKTFNVLQGALLSLLRRNPYLEKLTLTPEVPRHRGAENFPQLLLLLNLGFVPETEAGKNLVAAVLSGDGDYELVAAESGKEGERLISPSSALFVVPRESYDPENWNSGLYQGSTYTHEVDESELSLVLNNPFYQKPVGEVDTSQGETRTALRLDR